MTRAVRIDLVTYISWCHLFSMVEEGRTSVENICGNLASAAVNDVIILWKYSLYFISQPKTLSCKTVSVIIWPEISRVW